jgi:adenosylmethionine-8-amino-7-oxononanoate aminotransferase
MIPPLLFLAIKQRNDKNTHYATKDTHKLPYTMSSKGKNPERPITQSVIGQETNKIFPNSGKKSCDDETSLDIACFGWKEKNLYLTIREDLQKKNSREGLRLLNEMRSDLLEELSRGTDHKMKAILLNSSASTAIAKTMQYVCQYFYDGKHEYARKHIICREGSYHHDIVDFMNKYPLRPTRDNIEHGVYSVSSCNSYHQLQENESDEEFVYRKADELEQKFHELGSNTIIGFIIEPIVGTALGAVPYVPGYLKAMQDICHKYGALFILDEIICGMGRTGTLHTWQEENIVPDIEIISRTFGGGYGSVSATLVSKEINQSMKHGLVPWGPYTQENSPIEEIAALESLQMLRQLDILQNISEQGKYLGESLIYSLSSHPNVGNIRGKGLLWGIEFVKDKRTKEPFEPEIGVARGVENLANSFPFKIRVFRSSGNNDGVHRDCIMLMPPYTITKEEVEDIVKYVSAAVIKFFLNLK